MTEEERGERGNDLVVISILRETVCSECGQDLGKGSLLRREGDKGLCMGCADLDHLIFLPSGNTALSRRAGKHSGLRAMVLRWSRARKRYERQGVLVEEAALERAEEECLADEQAREARRKREAERRQALDGEYVQEFTRRVRARYKNCPNGEAERIAEHACLKYSGRVGRSAAAKRLEPDAIDLAVWAHIRHSHTNYVELLGAGHERFEAREMVRDRIEGMLLEWSGERDPG